MGTKTKTVLESICGVCRFTIFVFIVAMMSIAGCKANEKLEQFLSEKNRLEIECDRFQQDLIALKKDWAALQNKDASAKLIQELRDELRKAEQYKSVTEKQVNANIETIKWLRTQNDKLKKENMQLSKTLGKLKSEIAECKKMVNAIVDQQVRGHVYTGIGGGHWIREVAPGGGIIVLEDGSVWEISLVDRIDTVLWLPTTDIMVLENPRGLFPYLLVNTDDGEKAEAKLIGQQ